MIENNMKWTREAIGEFIKENEGLIYMVLRPYRGLNEYEDLVQEAYIGMMKGLQSFDPGKEAKLTTYVTTCARNEVRMYMRRNAAKARTAEIMSLDRGGGTEDEPEDLFDLVSSYVSTGRWITNVEETVTIRIALEKAHIFIEREMDSESRFIVLQHLKGIPQSQTAQKLGISQSKVSKTLKQALMNLKERLDK